MQRIPRMIVLQATVVLTALLTAAAPCRASDEAPATVSAPQADQPTLLPGLLASYAPVSDQHARAAMRIDRDILFVWEKASPDLRLPAGAFTARWRGKLLVPATGTYTLHVYLCGKIELRLGGARAIEGQSEKPNWLSSKPLQLERGYQTLEAQFTKTSEAAQVGLYWESPAFSLEPIGERWLYHDTAGAESADDFQRGHELVRAYRCAACHVIPDTAPPLKAPSLAALNGNIEPAWLVASLQSPHSVRADSRMPEFALGADDATAVASFLLLAPDRTTSANTSNAAARGDADHGESLFTTLGCLGCHNLGGTGNTGVFGGGSLDGVGRKRAAAALRRWLVEPEKLNPDHRMPLFPLERREASDLAAFLARQTRGQKPAAVADPSLIQRGKQLVETLRCAACHQIPGITKPQPLPLQRRLPRATCLGPPDPARARPGYNFAAADRDAVLHFLQALPTEIDPQSPFEIGRRILTERNCTGCHARDLEQGLQLGGTDENEDGLPAKRSGALEPPALTSAGDKFHEAMLEQLVQGGLPPYRPWLKVRMPRFNHSDADRAALLAFLVGHDRIPDSPQHRRDAGATDVTGATDASNAIGDPAELLLAGQCLVSSRGFGCMSCHAVGKHLPKDVDPSARGSDLLALDKRIRREWFLRWVRDPARIVPGMEMPAITVPVGDLLGGRIDSQIQVLWHALNSDAFVAPSSRDWAEQILALAPGDRPIVLRDVIYDAPPGSGWCARAFAVGLPNRHNLLFDLETLSLRAWWLGDFARERTEGKTWLWEPAGLPFWNTLPAYGGIALKDRTTGEVLLPVKEGQTVGWLEHWEVTQTQVHFSYRLRFAGAWIHVTETIGPSSHNDESGFLRELVVRGAPQNTDVILLHSTPRETAHLDANRLMQDSSLGTVTLQGPPQAPWQPVELDSDIAAPQKSFALMLPSAGAEILYLSSAQTDTDAPPTPNAAPALTSHRKIEHLPVVPGYDAVRLPLDPFVMPTAIAFLPDGTPVVCSLKGGVFLAKDTDGDGLEDTWQLFSDHLAAPFGVLTDGNAVIVSHKPELVRLEDRDGDGRAEHTEVIATGWGYNDNYHDWTFGLVRDAKGRYYVALGSDYQQAGRAKESSYLRGHALRITPPVPPLPRGGEGGVSAPAYDATANIEDLAAGLRFSAGIGINRDGAIFVTDNQGEQNTFNEINHLLPNSRYGVPGLTDPRASEDTRILRQPAIKVPHPLTRSVNGICFLEADGKFGPFEGHGIGCEYDTRALVRFSLQRVGDTYQGACYRFSSPETNDAAPAEEHTTETAVPPDITRQFLGPITCAVRPTGELYVGGIRDSGWGGGNNVGELVRLVPKGPLPLGIRELRATPTGFVIQFTGPVDPDKAADPQNYLLSSYRRIWKGTYATPDSDRRPEPVTRVAVAPDRRWVTLTLADLRPGFVYDLHVAPLGPDESPLWPSDAYYTMNVIPQTN